MDKVAKEIWCEALRSGEFVQGKNALCRDGKYCCLGVAREVFPWLEAEEDADLLSGESCEELGLTYDQQRILAAMNDGDHGDGDHSFAEIADYIEREL